MHTTSDIIELLRSRFDAVEVAVPKQAIISAPCSLACPIEDGVCFYNKKRWKDVAIETGTVALIIAPIDLEKFEKKPTYQEVRGRHTCLVLVSDPRAGFMTMVDVLFTKEKSTGIHPSAIVDNTTQIDPTARIGAGTVIGPGVEIGAHTEISELVVVVAGTKIGANCFIAPGVKIGQPGFGYQRQANGEMMHFPHIGSVVIGDHVEIGANTCIDRGTIDDTLIHNGVKIDNLCHISHNVEIQRDAVVIANSMIGGSVRVGPRAWIAPSVNVINGVTIGADVTAGMGATVVKPVADGQTVAGSPSVELSELIHQRRLLKSMLEAHEREQNK